MTVPMTKRQTVARAVAVEAAVAALAAALARRHPASAAALLAAGAAGAWGSFAPAAPLFGRAARHGPRTTDRASLTFDDGPGPSTADVLDALGRAAVRATFFVLGRQVRRHPELVRRMADEGHEIACHGDDHGILVFRGARHVDKQIADAERAVREALGADGMARLFRTPHGFRGPTTAWAARRRGYRTVAWTRGVFDSAEPGADVIARRAAQALAPGAVILLHDADGWDPDRSRAQTAAAIPAIAGAAADRGLALVTLGELLRR